MTIYKRGNIFWCKFRLDKKLYQFSCKTRDKRIAEEAAAATHADVIRKRFNLPQKFRTERLLGNIWQEYIKSLNNCIGTINKKKCHCKHFLPVFQDKNIKNITIADIKAYQLNRKFEYLDMPKNKDKRESEISFAFVNGEILTLSNFFNFCIEREYTDKNPATKIKKLNELSRLKTLSDTDIDRLIASATNKLTRDLISFLIYTGCRKGEALHLKWCDVDMQNGIIAIKATKTLHDRYIPVSKPLRAGLDGIEAEGRGQYVFERNGKRINNFARSFGTACRRAGLKNMHIHDLRHVFASKMVMGGTSLYVTGELLGHRTTQMTKKYSHLMPDTLQKAVNDVWNK